MPHQSSTPNVANRTLFEADNLPVMRGINSETIDLIATDPPFNKGKDFHATPDSLAAGAKFQDRWSWQDDVQGEWVDAIQDAEPGAWAVIDWTRMTYGDDMGAFLCFMAVRLLEMRRLLKPTGSLYLHCDPTASHYLKALMDAIFGRRNFQADLIWNRAAENLSRRKFRRAAENLLFYAKSGDYTWNGAYLPHSEEYVERSYRWSDDRGRYTTTSCTNNADRPNMVYEFHGNTRQWRYSRETMEGLEADGLLVFNEAGVPRRKLYLDDSPGVAVSTVWSDIDVLQSRASERTGYPTQKPLALYDRIIRASSNEGDWVLDPFAGCATTPIAAELAGRNWIGIDLWDGAAEVTMNRLVSATTLAGGEISAPLPTPRSKPPAGASPRTAGVTAALPSDHAVHHRTDAPQRTDGGDAAAPYLPTPTKGQRRPRLMTEHQIKDLLVAHLGLHCWGCNFFAPDPRYLALDHIRPRNSGGSDDIDNRALLCGPCNKIKRDHATLVSLRKANEHAGHLSGIHPIDLKEAGRWTRRVYEEALAARLSP